MVECGDYSGIMSKYEQDMTELAAQWRDHKGAKLPEKAATIREAVVELARCEDMIVSATAALKKAVNIEQIDEYIQQVERTIRGNAI